VKKRNMDALHYGMMMPKLRTRLVAAALFSAAAAWGCQVPVFRYALERWEPAAYLLRAPEGTRLPNIAEPVNLRVEQGATQLELFYPPTTRAASGKAIWAAPASAEGLRQLLDSPVRRQLRQRLLEGESAVWLLLESGDAAKDEAATKTIAEALQAAQQQLKLPEGVMTKQEASDPHRRRENADVLQADLPLKIAFSMLRLSRQQPEEAALMAMLTHMEPDLEDYAHEPMVFPIYGRGRALEPLIGKGIHAANILEASGYLCGACSCEIKEQNPGIDLLMAADWTPVASAEVVETVIIAPRAETKLEGDGRTSLWWLAGGVVLALAALRLLRAR
jgi:hypothetical protein